MAGISRWSVTTWLIIICAAMFIVDGFLPWRAMPTGRILLPDGTVMQMDPRLRLDLDAPLVSRNAIRPGTVHTVAMLDPRTGQPVAAAEIRYMPLLQSYLHFSTRQAFFQLELWRLIGFQFLHAGLGHIIANMIGLFFFGPMVEQYLGRKRYLAFYLLSGIFGALMYVLLNIAGYIVSSLSGGDVRIPGLLFDDPSTPLVGASAGVFGVIMAGAYLAPNVVVLLFFIIPMRLATLAWGLVVLALVTVLTEGHNAGGEAAHLGGAFAGYYFIRHPRHLHGFFDFLGRADPTSHHYRHRGKAAGDPRALRGVELSDAEIDRVLEKVHRDGLRSLTREEQEILARASDGRR